MKALWHDPRILFVTTVVMFSFLHIHKANAIQIVSTRQEFYVLNGQGPFYGNNSVTIQCSADDTYSENTDTLQVAGFDGVDRIVTVQCKRVTHLYAVDIKGYTFYDGQLQAFLYAIVPSNWNWNLTNGAQFVDPQGNPLHAPRKSYGLGSGLGAPGAGEGSSGGTIIDPDGGIDVVQCGATQAANQFFGGFLAGFLGPTTAASGCGGPYLSTETFTNWVKKQQDVNDQNLKTWEAQDEFNSVVNSTFNIVSQAVSSINASLSTIANYVDANNQFVDFQRAYNANTTAFVTRLANNVNQDLIANKEAINQNFVLISAVADNMATFVNQTSSNFEQVTLQMAVIVANTSEQLNLLSTQLNFLANQQVLNVLSLTTQLLRLQSLVVNWNQNTQLKRDISKILATSFNFQIEQETRTPFLPDLGVPPPADLSNLPPTLATTTVNIITRQFLYVGAANAPTMASIQFAWRCSTAAIGTNPTVQGSYVDTLGSLGPRNCSGPTGANMCNCWIDITDTRGVIDNTLNNPKTVPLNFWINGLNPQITLDIPGTSTPLVLGSNPGNIFSGPFNGIRITDSMTYINISEAICRLGIEPHYVVWTNGRDGGASLGYRVYSSFNNASVGVPYDAATCVLNIQQAMQPPTLGPFSPLYAEMQFAQTAYNLAIQQINPVQLFGSVANRLTWDYEPTATLAGGIVNALWRYFYMVFDPLTLGDPLTAPYYGSIPVWQLSFISTTAQILVSVDGGAQIPYVATVNNLADRTLFEDGYVGMGDPVLMWDNSVPAFNAPQQVLPLNPTKQGTCGTPIYNMMNTPGNLTYLAWVQNAQIPYDHTCGSNVARIYQQAIVGSGILQGTCDPNPILQNPAASGTLCNTLNNYAVTPTPDGNLILLSLQARITGPTGGDITEAIVSVPAGEVRNIVSTACPTSTQVINGFNTIQVIFTNGLTAPNTIRVTRLGTCPSQQTITLPPLGPGAPYTITFCPGVPEGQEEQLLVETLGAGNITQTVCTLVNVTTDYQQLGVTQSPSTVTTVRTYANISIDQTSVTQQAILNEIVLQQFTAIMAIFDGFLGAGLEVPPLALQSSGQILNNFVLLNQQGQYALANNSQRALGNYSGEAQDYATFYALNANQTANVANTMQNLYDALLKNNAAASAAGNALNAATLLLAGAAVDVSSNISSLAFFTNQTAVILLNGDRITLGDLLGSFVTGLANGIGDAAMEIAETAGDIIRDIAQVPAGLLRDLLTSIAGPILMISTAALAFAVVIGMIVMGVIFDKRLKVIEARLGIVADNNPISTVPGTGAPPSGPPSSAAASFGQGYYPGMPPSQQPIVQPYAMPPPPPAQQIPMAPPPMSQMAQILPPPAQMPQMGMPGYAVGKKGSHKKRARPAAISEEGEGQSPAYDEQDQIVSTDDSFDPRAPYADNYADSLQ
jgi:hypothetical protein